MTSLAGIKRKLEEAGELGGEHAAPPSKRLHSNESTALVLAQPSASALTIPTAAGIAAHQGTGLEAPHMALSGHAGAVQCVKFAPDGRTLASAGRDRAVFLWHVYGETDNFMSISPANKSAVLDLEWSPAGDTLYTVGADKCGGVWDAATGAKVRTLAGHTKVINALGVAPKGAQLLVTGSDDASVKVWDGRTRAPVQSFSERFPVLAVAASSEGLVYSAGIDGVIRQWDTRRSAVALSLEGHTEPVTGLALSPDGNGSTLLSFGQDGALKAWDVRPFVGSGADRCLKVSGRGRAAACFSFASSFPLRTRSLHPPLAHPFLLFPFSCRPSAARLTTLSSTC